MPIENGKYVNPGWVDNAPPSIDAAELNAMSDTLENLDNADPVSYTAGNGVSILNSQISARMSSQSGNTATFGNDGGIYVPTPTVSGGDGKRYARLVIGTSTAGWTEADCDYLCDGTSDQIEFRNAVNNLPSTGGEIVVLDGTYNFSASFNIQDENVSIRGNGWSTILKRQFDTSNYYPTTITGVLGVFADGCSISNIHIDGNSASYNSQYNDGIVVDEAGTTAISNCLVENCSSNGIASESGDNIEGLLLNSCTIKNCACGVNIGGASCINQVISGCVISGCEYGITCGGRTTITGNSLYNNTEVGVGVNITSNNIVICGNYILSPSSAVGVGINASSTVVSGNIILGSSTANVELAATGTYSVISGNVLNLYYGTQVPVSIKNTTVGTKNGNNLVIGNIVCGYSITSPDSTDLIVNNK